MSRSMGKLEATMYELHQHIDCQIEQRARKFVVILTDAYHRNAVQVA